MLKLGDVGSTIHGATPVSNSPFAISPVEGTGVALQAPLVGVLGKGVEVVVGAVVGRFVDVGLMVVLVVVVVDVVLTKVGPGRAEHEA